MGGWHWQASEIHFHDDGEDFAKMVVDTRSVPILLLPAFFTLLDLPGSESQCAGDASQCAIKLGFGTWGCLPRAASPVSRVSHFRV